MNQCVRNASHRLHRTAAAETGCRHDDTSLQQSDAVSCLQPTQQTSTYRPNNTTISVNMDSTSHSISHRLWPLATRSYSIIVIFVNKCNKTPRNLSLYRTSYVTLHSSPINNWITLLEKSFTARPC